MITFFIGLILVRLCKTNSKQNIPVPEENVMGSMKGPVYEEVELEGKTATIDLSQNIAYGQVKKTATIDFSQNIAYGQVKKTVS